jgi:hypothetical protein
MATTNDLASTNLWSFIAVFAVFFVYNCYQILSGVSMTMKDVYVNIGLLYFITFIVQFSSNAYLTGRKEICGKTDLGYLFLV